MGKKFLIVLASKTEFPIFCKQGLELHEVNGDRIFPVESQLGERLLHRVGEEIEEDFDFEVINRTMKHGSSWDRNYCLTNQGEVMGGKARPGIQAGWDLRIKKNGVTRQFYVDWLGNSDVVKGIDHAQEVETPSKLEAKKWKNLYKEFYDLFADNSDHTGKDYVKGSPEDVFKFFLKRTNLKEINENFSCRS